jgi:Sulfotransferase domain
MPKHFFIAGAQRSGTTYLYQQCAEHPQIEMALPVRPEPKYFINQWNAQSTAASYFDRYFGHKAGATVYGEKSTSYIEIESAAQRVADLIPDAKIVFVLRNPVERAISNYLFSVKHGVEQAPLTEAMYNEEQRRHNYDPTKISVSPFAYLQRGRYIDYIRMYERYFAPERMHIMIYEQMTNDISVIQQLYSFLGVDATFVSQARDEVINGNDNESVPVIDDALLRYLYDFFAESNHQLFARLGYTVADWASPFSSSAK